MKPASFFDLPGALQESLLWDIDLDYDSYESSKAEKIHDIMCDNVDETNADRIANAYKWMDEPMLLLRAQQMRESTIARLEALNEMIDALSGV